MATIAPSSHLSSCPRAQIDSQTGYITNIEEIRAEEFPALNETTYLDHAGTTPYAKSLIQHYSQELTSNLFGNPHSASASSTLSSRRIDDIRLKILRFFNANVDEFDIIFVANATAAIKLVADAFRDGDEGFAYRYHIESHTSLVGVRELAAHGHQCFSTQEVEDWLSQRHRNEGESDHPFLLGYAAQSNMTGQKYPMRWSEKIQNLRNCSGKRIFTLLDAAALLSTSSLDLSDTNSAPDFIALSFYKIFGFPDLGGLIVRKQCGDILRKRKYFGGGTVDIAIVGSASWHAKNNGALHTCVEDGTLPFHSIIALQFALSVQERLFGGMENNSKHANFLASKLRKWMLDQRHANGQRVFQIYGFTSSVDDGKSHGPVIAFNLLDQDGSYLANAEVEKLAMIKGIQFRVGGMCNPGGIKSHLNLSASEMLQNYGSGWRCGSNDEILNGKVTGVIRVSFGVSSSLKDVQNFVEFVNEYYTEKGEVMNNEINKTLSTASLSSPRFTIESLSVFPIKSCAAFKIPVELAWEVGPKGLAWDREWCLVHAGTSFALSQKKYPRMALLQPEIDLDNRILRIIYNGEGRRARQIEINLDIQPSSPAYAKTCDRVISRASNICGEDVDVLVYTSADVSAFFTEVLDVPCTLAKFPSNGPIRNVNIRGPGHTSTSKTSIPGRSISLSNESPILLISRSSVNSLNEHIKQNSGIGKAVAADSFRGNIVIAEDTYGVQRESPYCEESWKKMIHIGIDSRIKFEVLGPCQRCQMVCVDQKSAQRRQEPFSTLAKTRRKNGKVWFGVHLCVDFTRSISAKNSPRSYIKVGDVMTGTVS